MISHRSSLPTGAAATAVTQPEAVPSGTDATAPLDLLPADGARGLLRRFAPTGPGLRWLLTPGDRHDQRA